MITTAIRAALLAAIVVIGALTLAGFLARWTQPFEIISHFRVQYAAAAVTAAVLLGLLRAPRAAAAAAGFSLLNVAAVAASILPAAAPSSHLTSPVRVVWANLEKRADSLALIAELARAEHADFVAVTELPPGGAESLRQALPDFFCFTAPTGEVTTFTTVIASRAPCTGAGEATGLPRPSDASYADVAALRIVAVHPRPPWNNERTAERDGVIRAGFLIARAAPRTVLIGDFNASPWSPVMTDLTRKGFRRALCGAPFAPTWEPKRPWFALPIDHAYLHGDVAVAHCRTGPDIGSDHLPLILDVRVPPGGVAPSGLEH